MNGLGKLARRSSIEYRSPITLITLLLSPENVCFLWGSSSQRRFAEQRKIPAPTLVGCSSHRLEFGGPLQLAALTRTRTRRKVGKTEGSASQLRAFRGKLGLRLLCRRARRGLDSLISPAEQVITSVAHTDRFEIVLVWQR